MSIRKLFAISALAITAAMPTLASAADSGAAPCLLREHRVTSVTPYRVEEHIGKPRLPAYGARTSSSWRSQA